MAKPRIFVSSTFYDLLQVRSDIERFIQDLGYEPILHERGQVPYGSSDDLEEYVYREVELADILVAIVGGRYGSQSNDGVTSISQRELKIALESEKQVYLFVQSSVFSEYKTYLRNKSLEGVTYEFVDDKRVFEFLEEVLALPRNNVTASFDTAQDITSYLKEQWAGLFQRYLQVQESVRQGELIGSLEGTAKTLNELVGFLTEERANSDQSIQQILSNNHPIFARLKQILKIPYRVFFTTHDEFINWIKSRKYSPVGDEHWDDPKYEEWSIIRNSETWVLKIFTGIWNENGNLIQFTPEEWKREWVALSEYIDPDELPF